MVWLNTYRVMMPVEVQAVKWDGDDETYDNIRHWSVNRVERDSGSSLLVQTKNGVEIAEVGDFVVRGIHGGFYPVSARLFNESHEKLAANRGKAM